MVMPSRGGGDGPAAAGLTSPEIDAVKGVLISLIVLGHVHLLGQHLGGVVRTLYNFHAVAFLLLPFIFAGPKLGEVLRNRTIRYLVPFVVVFTVATILFNAVLAEPRPDLATACGRWLKALLLGTSDAFDQACGMELFWFLPALLGLTFWRAVRAASRIGGVIVLVAGVGMLLSLGRFPAAWARIPTLVTLGLYALPLGLALSALARRLQAGAGLASALTVVAFLGSLAWLAMTGRHYNIADFRVPAIGDLLGVALYAASAVLATPAIGFMVRQLQVAQPLAWLGRRSLQIYLGHLFLMTPLQVMWRWSAPWPVQIGVIFLVSLLLPALSFDIVERLPRLRRALFPRGWDDFLASFRSPRARQA